MADATGVSPLMRAMGQGNETATVQVVNAEGDVDCMDANGTNVLKLGLGAPTSDQVEDLLRELSVNEEDFGEEDEIAAVKIQSIMRGKLAQGRVGKIAAGELD